MTHEERVEVFEQGMAHAWASWEEPSSTYVQKT
jgi:hypothetical protein